MSLPYHDLAVSNTLLEANTLVGAKTGLPAAPQSTPAHARPLLSATGPPAATPPVHIALLPLAPQRERVSHAIKLGWDVVGLVHQATAKLAEAQDRCAAHPCHCIVHGRCLLAMAEHIPILLHAPWCTRLPLGSSRAVDA